MRLKILLAVFLALLLLSAPAFAADSGRWAVFTAGDNKYYSASADAVTEWTYAYPDENGNVIQDQNHMVPLFREGDSRYEKAMDAKPFVENGRSYVPVRYLALALGVPESGIVWDGKTRAVFLTMNNKTLKLVIGKNILYVGKPNCDFFRTVQMDVTPMIKDGRTYLPARFVAESFGYQVSWTQRVSWKNGATTVLVGPRDRLPGPPVSIDARAPMSEAQDGGGGAIPIPKA